MTGSRFARELTARGHDVHLMSRREPAQYDDVGRARLSSAAHGATVHAGVAHGSAELTALLRDLAADALLVHAHPMTDFRSDGYSIRDALDTRRGPSARGA